MRPDYGYYNLPVLTYKELNDIENDGLWKVDINTGRSKLIVTLQDACSLEPSPVFQKAKHKFNHVMISPDGRNMIFLHRYFIGKRRFDRLLLADTDTGVLTLLSDYGMVSHCFWTDNRTVLGYIRGPDGADAYWLIDILSKNFKLFPKNSLTSYGDGHPHVHGDWFVTDSYPDKARMQHLILCNWKTGETRKLGVLS